MRESSYFQLYFVIRTANDIIEINAGHIDMSRDCYRICICHHFIKWKYWLQGFFLESRDLVFLL